MISTIKRMHFVGIAGIGMSALAKICLAQGIDVQGSDSGSYSAVIQELEAQGVRVFLGHTRGYLADDIDCVVVSSAIGEENPEVQEAKEKGIPILHRSALLKELVASYRVIAITGTHGKTTTTSLMGYVLEQAGLDPLIISGGIMGAYGTNVRFGQGVWAVVEADESDKSHLNFETVWGGIATNIEAEHMNTYQSFALLVDSFSEFLRKATHVRIVCGDDPELAYMSSKLPNVITYGLGVQCSVRGQNLRWGVDQMSFDVVQGDTFWANARMGLLGKHNVCNALAVIAMAREIDIPEPIIARALLTFPGVHRRLTVTGRASGMVFIDDYAHHPTEIKAVLETLRHTTSGRVIAVCQPHRYSRLNECMALFAECFDHADHVVLLPVYSAGETPLEGISSEVLQKNVPGAFLCDENTVEGLADVLQDIVCSGDTIVCFGAGDITHMAHQLPAFFVEPPCVQSLA